jgi:hypothetical protein
LVVAFPV